MKPLIILFVTSLFNYSISTPINEIENNNNAIRISEREVSNLMSTANIERPALGRVASLGDLYDVRNDQFIEISLYQSKVSRDAIHVTDTPHSDMKFIRSESLSDKMHSLDITASLAVSFMSGKVSVTGSAEYLNSGRKTSKSAKTSIKYSVRTVQENLKIFYNASVELMNMDLLTKLDATHIVVGIQWGADVVLSLEQAAGESSNLTHIHGELQAKIETVMLTVTGNATVNTDLNTIQTNSSFNLTIYADIVPNVVPQTINEAVAFIQNIPDLVSKTNGGKGKIMRFILMPIRTVQEMLENVIKDRQAVQDLNQDLVNQFMQIFQEMSDTKLQINDVYNDIAKWAYMVPEEDFKNIKNLKTEFQIYENNIKINFSKLIVKLRNGKINDTKALKQMTDDYKKDQYTPAKIEKSLGDYNETLHKVRLLDLFERFNARFMDRRADRYKTLIGNFEQEIGIISLNLGTNITSHYIRNTVRLLKVEMAKETAKPKDEAEKAKTKNPERKTNDEKKNELNPQTFRMLTHHDWQFYTSAGNISKPENATQTNVTGNPGSSEGTNTSDPSNIKNEVKPITYYIKHDPDLAIPNVTIYLKGKIQKTHLIDKKEYIIVVSESGKVIIMDAHTYDQTVTFKEPSLEHSTFAIVNEVLYNIATKQGLIKSTNIENIFINPGNIKWDHVGSFPKELCEVRSVAAVHGSVFHFVTCDGYIYEYHMVLKTVTICGKVVKGAVTSHLITVGEVVYIQINETLYSLEGTELTTIDTKSVRKSPGLFEFEGKACQVGGEPNTADKYAVRCYDSANKNWLELSHINNPRQNPGVVKTTSGTIIFGGQAVDSNGKETGKLESAEIFSHVTKNWSYIAIPSAMNPDLYSASSFIF